MKILHNAKIITMNPNQPRAEALVINHHAPNCGRIVEIGSSEKILAKYERDAKSEDLHGATILPGLTDAHIHLKYYALNLKKIDLFNASKAECLALVAQRATDTPSGEWILGHGWNQNNWPEGLPTAAELDKAATNHPVHLTHVSLHSSWENSSALVAAGINAATQDPKNGKIVRDERGNPTGVLLETASQLVESILPSPSDGDNIQAIADAQQALWRMGVTGVHDYDRIPSFIALQRLHQRGDLKLRVLKNLPVESIEAIIASGLRSGFGDDMLRIGGIKVFADGALGSQTAAMLAPYEGQPDNRGISFLDSEELFEIGRQAVTGGLSLTVHAIGDAANHQLLNSFEQLRAFEKVQGLPNLRHRIEHAQILHPDDIPRFVELSLTASMQPIHATADMLMADVHWGERARYAYAWQSLEQAGTRMAFGSDAPVDTPNPFHGIYSAVTRRRTDGSPGTDGWRAEECISLESAFKGYTSGAAYAAGMEDDLGMLSPGYFADLIILPDDPFKLEIDQLHAIQPTATMVGGEWVWRQ
ncbi:MAG: amidohydrolase [Chloroflexota bacterium]